MYMKVTAISKRTWEKQKAKSYSLPSANTSIHTLPRPPVFFQC